MKYSLTLLLLLFFGTTQAQSSFNVSATSVWTIASQSEPDVEGHIVISNPTNATQSIKWERTVINITNGCQSQVCDLNLCYIPSVSTKTFDIATGASGNIIMHFLNPDELPDPSALVHLKLSNLNNPADSVVISYLFTPETSGTGDKLPAASVKLFPNPATDYFRLENAADVQNIRLFGLDGREAARFSPLPGSSYSLAGLTSGAYILVLEDKNGRAFQAIDLVKR